MALLGKGTVLQMGSGGSTETFTPIDGCESFDFGSNKIDTHDTTQMDSPGNFRVFIPGLEDAGDLSVKGNTLPGNTSQTSLSAAKGLVKDFKVIYPGSVLTVAFQGIITAFDHSIPLDKPATFSLKIKIVGGKTDTPGS